MWVQLEFSAELGFGFYWVRVSFFFSSDSRAELDIYIYILLEFFFIDQRF